MFGIIARFSASLALGGRICLVGQSQLIHASPVVCAEPMKKKKRVDPSLLIAREQRAKRRLEKAIRRLEKASRKLKPIDEIIGDYKLARDKNSRRRQPDDVTAESAASEASLLKEWTKYTLKQHRFEITAINDANRSQERALNELKKISPNLYNLAIQPDHTTVPFERSGATLTPPIANYQSPDGDYQDVTKTYEFPLTGNTTTIVRNLVPGRRK